MTAQGTLGWRADPATQEPIKIQLSFLRIKANLEHWLGLEGFLRPLRDRLRPPWVSKWLFRKKKEKQLPVSQTGSDFLWFMAFYSF